MWAMRTMFLRSFLFRVSAILSTSFDDSRVKDQSVSRQFKVVVRFGRCCDRWYLGKLRVNQEVHARVGSVRLTWLNRAA